MLTRRAALGLGGALAAAALTGCSSGGPDADGAGGTGGGAVCVPRSALTSAGSLAGLPLRYEPTGRRTTFWFDAAFLTRLQAWADALPAVLPEAPTTLTTYGSWIDGQGRCDSWHHAGRAFDLARVRLTAGEVSCRYDQWRDLQGPALDAARRDYWALAAGLHARFAYVLTYLYDAEHANHLHVDDSRSGNRDSAFRSGSRVQVQVVQAVCSYLFARPVELSGRWDGATRRAVGAVLDELGLADDLAEQASWQGLLAAAAARGRR